MIDLKLAFIIIVNVAAGNIESTVKKVSVQQLINDYQLVCDQGSTTYKLQLFDTPLTKCISFHLYLSFKRSQNVIQSKVIAVPKSNSNLTYTCQEKPLYKADLCVLALSNTRPKQKFI